MGGGFSPSEFKDPLLADVPVVIMSGCRDVAQTAKDAGVVAVVRKPKEPQTLLRVIDHFEERV
jgi:FixJ family two-component response regulator